MKEEKRLKEIGLNEAVPEVNGNGEVVPRRARPCSSKAGIKWISHNVTKFVKSSKPSKSKSAVRKKHSHRAVHRHHEEDETTAGKTPARMRTRALTHLFLKAEHIFYI